jgi:hypothetical protein
MKNRIWCIFYSKDGANWAEIWAETKTYRSDQRLNHKDYFNQIIAHWSLIDRVIRSENERDLSNPSHPIQKPPIFLRPPPKNFIFWQGVVYNVGKHILNFWPSSLSWKQNREPHIFPFFVFPDGRFFSKNNIFLPPLELNLIFKNEIKEIFSLNYCAVAIDIWIKI